MSLAAPAAAQRVRTPTEGPVGVPPGAGGVGGGAGLIPELPSTRGLAAPTLPPAPTPTVTPEAAPAAPARAVRFRCALDSGAETCREAGAPDGGGDDSECNCARDHCYESFQPALERSLRFCEKLQ